jgi:hypothetical protein
MARPVGSGVGVGTQLLLVLLGVLLGVLGLLLLQRTQLLQADQAQEPPVGAAQGDGRFTIGQQLLARAEPSKIVYLNREGAELRGGPDDASFNISSVVAGSPSNRARVPPFAGTTARWNAITKCIREKFASFDVTLVEQRPVEGDYVMAMLGGAPKDLGLLEADGHKHSHATGLAPFNGEAIPRAVIFVFTRALQEHARSSCEVAGMEIAHAYGLDHARNCKDLMTYMRPCGARSFMDRDLPCGEHEDRPCLNGTVTQNSHRHLLRLLGPAVAASPDRPAASP